MTPAYTLTENRSKEEIIKLLTPIAMAKPIIKVKGIDFDFWTGLKFQLYLIQYGYPIEQIMQIQDNSGIIGLYSIVREEELLLLDKLDKTDMEYLTFDQRDLLNEYLTS